MKVTSQKVTPPPVNSYTITLNSNEAGVLLAILGKMDNATIEASVETMLESDHKPKFYDDDFAYNLYQDLLDELNK